MAEIAPAKSTVTRVTGNRAALCHSVAQRARPRAAPPSPGEHHESLLHPPRTPSRNHTGMCIRRPFRVLPFNLLALRVTAVRRARAARRPSTLVSLRQVAAVGLQAGSILKISAARSLSRTAGRRIPGHPEGRALCAGRRPWTVADRRVRQATFLGAGRRPRAPAPEAPSAAG